MLKTLIHSKNKNIKFIITRIYLHYYNRTKKKKMQKNKSLTQNKKQPYILTVLQ